MAEENVTTNIVVNSNFSNLIGDLNKASAALINFKDKLSVSNKALAQQVSAINRTFAETMRSTGQFSTHFVSLSSDVQQFGSQLDKGQIKLKQFFQTFQEHTKTQGGLIRQLAQQQVQLQNSILQPLGRNAEGLMQYNVQIPRGLDLVKNKTAIARQELQILNKVVQEGANQLINWGKNTQWAGRQLTVGLSVPLMAFGSAAANAFKTADQELTRLTKVYGGVAATSTSELQKIRKDVAATATELSKAYGSSFQDTLALAADIAATGKQGNDLLNSVRETTRLAVLGEVDRQDAMKATLAIQTAFKENTSQLSESINFLNAVENQTSTTLQDLVTAIPKAGPVIKGLGGNVKDLALYLTAMREGGISATEAANALKSGLASLINPTKVATNTFMGFGINLNAIVNKNAGNTTATILELQAALDKLDPLKKQKALEQLFGKFQFARMNALFSNLGKQGSQTLQVLDLMKASSQDLANIATRELAQSTESASGKYKRALEGLKADLASVGNGFLTINTALINIVDKVINFANHLPKPLKQLLSVLGMFTAAAGPLIMLTGVMGNFIGYIVKGIFHLKSLFKGGEGWKLLTPEILAASRAGTIAEQTFYSDAKAASIFNQAVQGLTGSLSILETKLNSGILNIAPQMANMSMGMREVNPQHPLVSAVDTRSMSHMNPVAGMTDAQKQAQTLFGVVPGAPKVNQKIGAAPQIYMSGDLPKISGLTSIRGVSTGVVAAEAAKWHSMTAALAMQSEAEIAKLKTEVAQTGLVTEEVSSAYETLLPKMNQLVQNAATEAAKIVEQLQAGKITVDTARTEIIALNARVEQMMAQTATQTATQLGRTIDITKVPLLNQPIVDTTGKSNLKEITKPGRTRDLLNKIAGVLGVKTYGAGYSIETTIPKRLNQGDIVPGTGNQDTVPALLTPGEFIVNKSATEKHLPLLQAINQNKEAGFTNAKGGYMSARVANAILKSFGYTSKSSKKQKLLGNWGMLLHNDTNVRLRNGKATGLELINQLKEPKSLIDLNDFLMHNGVDEIDILRAKQDVARKISSNLDRNTNYSDPLFGTIALSIIDREIKSLDNKYPKLFEKYLQDRMRPGRRDTISSSSSHGPSPTPINIPGQRPSNYGAGDKANKLVWAHFHDQKFLDNIESLAQNIFKRKTPSIAKISPSRLAQITARWNDPIASQYGPVSIPRQQKVGVFNDNPYHGPLVIGRSGELGGHAGYSAETQASFKYGLPRKIWYDANRSVTSAPGSGVNYAFPTGSPKEQALYALKQYMLASAPAEFIGLSSVQKGLSELMQKHSGKVFRGVSFGGPNSVPGGLPTWLAKSIYEAEQTGDFSGLIGKHFMWRSSSWSENKSVAARFSQTYHPGQAGTLFEVNLQDRNVVPASKIFPDVKYSDHQNLGGDSEQEMLFGGAFKIVHAEPGRIVLSTSPGVKKREFGGDVSKNRPYIVGEKGAELFVPGQSGAIVPHYKLGGLVGKAAGFGLSMLGGQMASNVVSGMGIPDPMGITSMAAFMGGSALTGGLMKFGTALKQTKGETDRFKTALNLLQEAGNFIPGWGKIAAVVAVGIGTVAYKLWTSATKARQASQDAIRANKNESSQLGITYKSALDNVKATTDALFKQQDLLKAKAAGASGPAGGVNLTIQQLKTLQQQVKSTSPDIIKMFDNMAREDVVKNVADLKAQMISSGVEATVATNKIYAMLTLSNKAAMATQAIGSKEFTGIYDQKSAAQHSTNALSKALSNKTDVKELVNYFDQGLNAVDSYYTSISNVKDVTGKLVFDNKAVAKTIQDITNSEGGRVKLGKENLANLLAQKPELNNILNASDTIASAWAKYKLYTSGVVQDLSKISQADAVGMLQVIESIKSATTDLTTKNLDKSNPFRSLVKAGIDAKAAAQAAQTASDNASTAAQASADAQTKAIDSVIKQLNKEYDARKKIIDQQTSKESYGLSLQQEQLKYQQAIANGDQQGAAQAQVNMRQLNLEYQKTQALAALEDKHNADLIKQEDARAAVADKLAASQAKAAKLAEIAVAAQQRASNISIIQQSIANTLTLAAMTKDPQQLENLGKSLQSDINALSKLDAKAAAAIPISMTTKLTPKGKVTSPDYTQTLMDLSKPGGALFDAETKTAMSTFGLTLDKFNAFWAKILGLPNISLPGSDKVTPGQEAGKTKIKTVTASTFKDAVKKAQLGEGTRKWISPTNDSYSLFTWNGDTYALDDFTGTNVYRYDTQKKAITGDRLSYASGGLIRGPGTGTSDSIYMPKMPFGKFAGGAWVSNGEYIVNAASVRKPGMLNLLDRINNNSFNMPSRSSFAVTGGGSFGGTVFNPIIHVHGAPGQDERLIGEIVAARLKDMSNKMYNQYRAQGTSKVVGGR